MSATAAFGVCGVLGLALMLGGMLLEFPQKIASLTGGQALIMAGFVITAMGLVFSLVSRP